MLKLLELENFKAFGRRVKIPFAPITLIFGENSSGKSTILQALNLLKQTRESREVGALLLPRSEQGIVDLGSFHELLFEHDLQNTLKIKIDVTLQKNFLSPFLWRNYREFVDFNDVGLEFGFRRPSLEHEIELEFLKMFLNGDKLVANFEVVKGKEIQKKFFNEFMRDIHLRISRGIMRKSNINKLKIGKSTKMSDDPFLWKKIFKNTYAKKDEIISLINHRIKELKSGIDQNYNFRFEISKKELKKMISQLNDSKEFFESNFTLEEFIKYMTENELDTYIALDGFIPIASYKKSSQDIEYIEWKLSKNRSSNPIYVDIGRLATISGRLIEQNLESLFPLGPWRKPPERWYIFTGTSPQDVGYRGDQLPDLLFRTPELVEKANEWLNKLDIGYNLKVKSLGPKVKDLFEVRLIDIRQASKVEVGLSDVGFGISQILPFIVQSLASEGRIISIEQPEVHIHPRLQADLGDLLAETIKEPQNNQFIIETHSEHLVLRLQKLIRYGKLNPDDVSIIYVSRGKNGSIVKQLRVDQSGDFIDDWPGGFFPERLKELM